MTSITVLGPVAVGDEGAALSPRDRVVLSVLVARRGREVPADTIAEAMWGDDLPASWNKVVQGCVARLRRRLGKDAILTGGGGYRLAVPAEDVDAGRFERLVRRSHELLVLEHADEAAYAAQEALSLWRGTPLADLVDWPPGRGEAERLEELRLKAEEVRLDALLSSGRHAEVLPEARLRVQEEPLREHRWALLARAQYQDGRQADALATLRRARDVLADELGLDPGPELVGLEQAVLQQDPGLAVPTVGTAAVRCPWPGLASYDVEDADTFFGRERELAECRDRLSRAGFLAVVGPSGSGKSSLVRAGLAARLREEGLEVRVITPDPRPLEALEEAASGRSRGSVLVVDQCEEIFSPQVPEPVRAQFLGEVAAQGWGGRTEVVLTLRADRLGELTAYPDVARLVEEGLYLLKAIGPDGVRAAIEQPARRAGLLLEQGLVDLLVRDVEGEPGSLPLLAHALRQTWERREGNTLTVRGYHESGGIRGAIARSAEQVYEAASEQQRHTLRELLLRMVQPGPGGEPVRTSLGRDAVTDAEHADLVERLVRARLVTAEADRLEIAHEALARAWPRLQSWLADDVQGERIRHHLAATAQAWQAMGRPPSELYRGSRLAAAREWRQSGGHRLTPVEEEFLAASEDAHRSDLARAEDDARRQRRLNRRLRLLVAGAVVLALVAAAFGTVARAQWRDARAANEMVQAEAARARSHELAASAVAAVDENPGLAKALAILAAEAAPASFQSKDALHRTIAADRVVSRISMNHGAQRLWAVLHPDGDRVAMAAENVYFPGPALEVHDAGTGHLVWEWVVPARPGHESAVVAGAQYSPDGAILAAGVLWHPGHGGRLGPAPGSSPPPEEGLLGVHLWDARTHEHLGVVDVGPCGGWPVAVGGDHLLVRTLVAPPSKGLSARREADLLAGCRWDEGAMGTVVVDRTTGDSTLLMVVEALALNLTVGHALSDDGALAMVPDFATGTGVLVETAEGRELARMPGHIGFDFDPTGERLLVLDRRDPVIYNWRVVSVPDLEPVTSFNGHQASSFYGRFSPDGTSVFTTGLDNVLMQWNAGTGELLGRAEAIGSGPPTSTGPLVLVPRPDTVGAVLVGTLPPGELWSSSSCRGTVGRDRLRVAGELVVVGRDCDDEPQGRLETLTLDGDPVRSWEGVSWEGIEVSPDGRLVVARDRARAQTDPAAPRVGALRVRSLESDEATVTLEGFCEHGLPIAYIGIPEDDPALRRCGGLGEPPFTFVTWVVRWSPDGRWIAAISEDATRGGAAVWDASTGDLATTLLTPGSDDVEAWGMPYDLRFSAASDRLVLTSMDGRVMTVDTATWEVVSQRRLDLHNADSPGLVGHAADGSMVVVSPLFQNAANTSIALVDPTTLTVRRVRAGVAEGTVQDASVSPDGTHLALATSEGVVTVWDLEGPTLVDRADPGLGRLDGVRWMSQHELVVLSVDGHLSTVTTDADHLLDVARASLTRAPTRTECVSYGISPCPSLTDLRRSDPVVPVELRGAYLLQWSEEELAATTERWAESAFGGLDERSRSEVEEQAELLAGSYRLELGGSDYTITKGELGEVWCTGSVTRGTSRPDRLLLGADSGARCRDFHYVELGWDLEDQTLLLPQETFRGPRLDTLLWTSKPLVRVGADPDGQASR